MKSRKKITKTPYFGVQDRSRSLMLVAPEKSSFQRHGAFASSWPSVRMRSKQSAACMRQRVLPITFSEVRFIRVFAAYVNEYLNTDSRLCTGALVAAF